MSSSSPPELNKSPPAPAATNTETSTPITNPPRNTDDMAVTASRPTPGLSLFTQDLTSSSPPQSPLSSTSPASKRRSRSPLSLDLSTIPPLSSPSPPSNTLLITRLTDPKIFHPASLATIREHITSIAPLNSFSPLKSMSRLIVSFYNEADAIKVRQEIDRTAFTPDCICKIYFGEPTPVGDTIKFLERPDAGKLFFISPPPSPPVGWESKSEDPPNKQVHADDLMDKLSRLTGKMDADPLDEKTVEESKAVLFTAEELRSARASVSSPTRRAFGSVSEGGLTPVRSRSSTLIYDPVAHGESPGLPAVVLDHHDDVEAELDLGERPMVHLHTARPPVELMEQ